MLLLTTGANTKPETLTFAARMRELSLVIPVMNEEDNIKPLLDAVDAALRNFDYEVILKHILLL